MKKYILCIVFICVYLASGAQQKYERESGIRSEEAPDTAVSYIAQLFGPDARVRWYREESLEGIRIEAKTKQVKGTYSVKFDTDGRLLDIELTQKAEEIPSQASGAINAHLAATYDRYKIRKIQVQWTGAPDVLHQLIRGKPTEDAYTVRYEVEHSGRLHGNTKPYETLFDSQGKPIETKEIVPRSMNHLIY